LRATEVALELAVRISDDPAVAGPPFARLPSAVLAEIEIFAMMRL
jgi:hypothetical protein